MTLRTKIYGGYLVPLFLFIITFVYLSYLTENRDQLLDSISKIDFSKVQYIGQLEKSLNTIEEKAVLISSTSELKEIILNSELIDKETSAMGSYFDSLTTLVHAGEFEFNSSMARAPTRFFVSSAALIGLTNLKYFDPIHFDEETLILEKMRKVTFTVSTRIELGKRLFALKKLVNTANKFDKDIKPLIDSLRPYLGHFEKASMRHTLAKMETLSQLSTINSAFTYAVLSLLFLLIIMAILDARSILTSIKQLTVATQHVGLGTFDQKLEIRNFEEMNNLGIAFNRMTQQLEEMEKLKSDLFTKLVHDFKSPLDNIKQSSAVLAKDMAGAPLTSQQKKFIDIIQRSAGELRNMVQFQLEESKLLAGQSTLTFQLTDIRELLKERIQLQRPTATAKNINFSVKFTDTDFQIHCDAFKILRVIDNLLSNSIKFSPRDSTISIELETQDEKIQVRIKDSGTGIPLELQPQIFQKYARQVNSDTASGTGLGLYTAKYIIELHGGKIWFKSKPGFGTTFYFSLPKQNNFNPAQAIG